MILSAVILHFNYVPCAAAVLSLCDLPGTEVSDRKAWAWLLCLFLMSSYSDLAHSGEKWAKSCPLLLTLFKLRLC